MLNGIHFLLTYTCNFECDHCFLYCGPRAQGTFTLKQVQEVLDDAKKIGSVEWIFFEGGEPFLFFPLLQEGIKIAHEMDFKVGVVTNAYGATCIEDAKLWLKPLSDAGLTYLSISNDTFHYGDEKENPARFASIAAKELGIEASLICIEPPKVETPSDPDGKGKPVVGGGAKFRGRAAEKLTKDLPLRPWNELVECPFEELEVPSRVHIDAFGTVHICQGISMGNMWEIPLSELVKNYQFKNHPICNALIQGGPAQLAKEFNFPHDEGYVDECHLCFETRKQLIEKFPNFLTPKQVYGLE